MDRHLLVSAIITPDGTRLESEHRHDYKSHVDNNGETYMIDGGTDYIRRSVNKIPCRDAFIYSDDSHVTIRENFKWGTYGKDGEGPFERKTLSTLEDAHIQAILELSYLKPHIKHVFENELIFRKTLLAKK
jgi:hypothetical protein